eukprot:TRINITY_DN1403_c0_g1_i1.p1 TRINITY_DN1403_c0_g1~~TRINITY_DN1403_c0_g1_i1.p1  ORF type:complete len:583 (+),score=127.96 TRINITY_DN1403_c0_g1_i1:518-2266(+)
MPINDEWESSSTTAQNLKRHRPSSDWKSNGNEEVGDTDDIQTRMAVQVSDQGKTESKRAHKVRKKSHKKLKEITWLPKNGAPENEDQGTKKEPVTVDETRHCMQSVITELKKAREDMLSWLRQEMQKIFVERSARNGGGKSACKVKVEYEEKAASECNGVEAAVEFGTQESGNEEAHFFAQNNNNTKNEDGVEGYNTTREDSQEAIKGKKLDDCSKESGFADGKKENTAQVELGFQVKDEDPNVEGMDFGERQENGLGFVPQDRHHEGNGGELGFGVENRDGSMSMDNGSVQVLSFDRPEDDFMNFRHQNEAPTEIGFVNGHQSGGSGGMRFCRDNQLIFGCQNIENGSSRLSAVTSRNQTCLGGSSIAPVNSSGNNRKALINDSDKDRTHDLIGMQNPLNLGMVWNSSAHNGQSLNHPLPSHSSLNDFSYDVHAKVGHSAPDAYRGLIHANNGYESSLGIVGSAALQAASSAMGAQLPTSLQAAATTSNSLCRPSLTPFMGLPNQVSVSNFNGMQNFLGLSMNGSMGANAMEQEGIRRHVLSGMFMNERSQHPSKMNSVPVQARARKRNSLLDGVDLLELN